MGFADVSSSKACSKNSLRRRGTRRRWRDERKPGERVREEVRGQDSSTRPRPSFKHSSCRDHSNALFCLVVGAGLNALDRPWLDCNNRRFHPLGVPLSVRVGPKELACQRGKLVSHQRERKRRGALDHSRNLFRNLHVRGLAQKNLRRIAPLPLPPSL